MSFSSEVKEELSRVSNHNNECCKLAELAGYLITNCNIVKENDKFVLKMTTINPFAIRRVYNAFKNGEIDVVDVTIANVEEYIGSIGYKKIEYKSRDYDFLALNTANEVFSDKEVRKAISKIIDKNNIVASCLGAGYVASNFSLDMGDWLYTKDVSVAANTEEAKQILTRRRMGI